MYNRVRFQEVVAIDFNDDLFIILCLQLYSVIEKNLKVNYKIKMYQPTFETFKNIHMLHIYMVFLDKTGKNTYNTFLNLPVQEENLNKK